MKLWILKNRSMCVVHKRASHNLSSKGRMNRDGVPAPLGLCMCSPEAFTSNKKIIAIIHDTSKLFMNFTLYWKRHPCFYHITTTLKFKQRKCITGRFIYPINLIHLCGGIFLIEIICQFEEYVFFLENFNTFLQVSETNQGRN